jgi:hypothetical protein
MGGDESELAFLCRLVELQDCPFKYNIIIKRLVRGSQQGGQQLIQHVEVLLVGV